MINMAENNKNATMDLIKSGVEFGLSMSGSAFALLVGIYVLIALNEYVIENGLHWCGCC